MTVTEAIKTLRDYKGDRSYFQVGAPNSAKKRTITFWIQYPNELDLFWVDNDSLKTLAKKVKSGDITTQWVLEFRDNHREQW